ncbi:MAG: AlpA family phage regulatory protein [Alphaproteobacteria bacterium]|nr:MAG: AlpA family phage regulatory protein [Alphaproteobacteria bacterium]
MIRASDCPTCGVRGRAPSHAASEVYRHPMEPEMVQQTPTPARFVTVKELIARSTLSRATIYAGIAAARIPRPTRLSPRRVGWPAEVVDAWLAARAGESDQ